MLSSIEEASCLYFILHMEVNCSAAVLKELLLSFVNSLNFKFSKSLVIVHSPNVARGILIFQLLTWKPFTNAKYIINLDEFLIPGIQLTVQFLFLKFQLPTVTISLQMLNGNFQR